MKEQETSGNVMMLAQAQARNSELETLNKALSITLNKRTQELFNLEVELVQEKEQKELYERLYRQSLGEDGQSAEAPPPGLPGMPAPPPAPQPQSELKKLKPVPETKSEPKKAGGIRKRPTTANDEE